MSTATSTPDAPAVYDTAARTKMARASVRA